MCLPAFPLVFSCGVPVSSFPPFSRRVLSSFTTFPAMRTNEQVFPARCTISWYDGCDRQADPARAHPGRGLCGVHHGAGDRVAAPDPPPALLRLTGTRTGGGRVPEAFQYLFDTICRPFFRKGTSAIPSVSPQGRIKCRIMCNLISAPPQRRPVIDSLTIISPVCPSCPIVAVF